MASADILIVDDTPANLTVDYVPKPVRQETIFAKLEQHLGLRFHYQESLPAPTVRPATASAMDLKRLSVELRSELRHAVQEFDPALTAAAIARVRAVAPDVAESLAVMAQAYQFDAIEALLDTSEQP